MRKQKFAPGQKVFIGEIVNPETNKIQLGQATFNRFENDKMYFNNIFVIFLCNENKILEYLSLRKDECSLFKNTIHTSGSKFWKLLKKNNQAELLFNAIFSSTKK